ncbi:MAG: glycoside hydrolase family 99-like domain-containing protein [Agrococcus casei]|uniref:glycoside hydrolase family 99-like domain-containing protein n=1 Tax=Agrococcus casei TaxID=343512 RepID=UPI003F8DCA2B
MRRITKAGVKRRLLLARTKVGDAIAGRVAPSGAAGHPAGFDAFVVRNEGAHFVGFPSSWRVQHPQWAETSPIAVVLHVFYVDLIDEICEQLAEIPIAFDLIVTDATGKSIPETAFDAAGAARVRVLEVDNHGRDIWPLLQVVNAGYVDDYDIVLKLHTKKSEWRAEHEHLSGDGESWKQGFYRALLGSGDNVAEILGAFLADPSLGVVTSDESIVGSEHWGGDEEIATELLRRLQLRLDPPSLRFPSGSIYWIRGFLLQGLRALMIDESDFEPEVGQTDGTTAHAIERLIGVLSTEAGFEMAERAQLDGDSPRDVEELARALAAPDFRARCVSFYLPQFHPFSENDSWWGEGFTEWTNVTKAKPVFRGQSQPLLPSELGFYDLRLDLNREVQQGLAKRHGIDAFMYYYYWFSGHKLMETPIERLVASDIDQPFCIMWANENWTRRWDGNTKHVLIEQEYDKVPAEDFIDDIMPLLLDSRYVRVDGRAVVAVYRIAQIPDYHRVLEVWRERAREAGAGELHIMSVDVGSNFDGLDMSYRRAGVQGALAFPPHNHEVVPVSHAGLDVDPGFRGGIYDYAAMCRAAERKYLAGKLAETDFPGAMVAFDNTARRQWEPDVWFGANPFTFRRWLRACVAAVAHRPEAERIVIVNAWNEWAEGAVLEPTRRWGKTFLKAARSALL